MTKYHVMKAILDAARAESGLPPAKDDRLEKRRAQLREARKRWAERNPEKARQSNRDAMKKHRQTIAKTPAVARQSQGGKPTPPDAPRVRRDQNQGWRLVAQYGDIQGTEVRAWIRGVVVRYELVKVKSNPQFANLFDDTGRRFKTEAEALRFGEKEVVHASHA